MTIRAALIPADELTSGQQTAHLLSSPRNAARLLSALVRSRKRSTPPVELETLMCVPASRRTVGLVVVTWLSLIGSS